MMGVGGSNASLYFMAKKQLIEEIENRTNEKTPITFVSTGCTLLNLALSGNADGGFPLGTIVRLIGDSATGKSVLSLMVMAEAVYSKKYEDYQFIKQDSEHADLFDLQAMFGKKTAEKIVIKKPSLLEHVHMDIKKLGKEKKPFFMAVDSLDGLSVSQDIEKSEETLDAMEKGKTVTGTYGMARAKYAANMLREVTSDIGNTNSLLIVVGQTKDNVSPMGFGGKVTSGGKAWEFYGSQEVWLAKGGEIKKSVRGIDRTIGRYIGFKIRKCRTNGGRTFSFDIPMLYDYGYDNVWSMIEWLAKEQIIEKDGTIGKSSTTYKFVEPFEKEGKMETLIQYIEENCLEEQLKKYVEKHWLAIQEELKPVRKSRYEDEN